MIRYLYLSTIIMFNSSVVQAVELAATLEWAGLQRYGFAVNGVVEPGVVSVGTKVKAGDVLAKLDVKPFNYRVNQYQSEVKKLDPVIFDAKLELDHAEELYERTVLSEVELQKIDGKYKALQAELEVVKAQLNKARWKAKRAVLKANDKMVVIKSDIVPGLIVSDENKSNVFIEMASAKKASAITLLTSDQKIRFRIGDMIKVIVDQQTIPAKINSIGMLPDKENKYSMSAVFYYSQTIEPGKLIKVSY